MRATVPPPPLGSSHRTGWKGGLLQVRANPGFGQAASLVPGPGAQPHEQWAGSGDRSARWGHHPRWAPRSRGGSRGSVLCCPLPGPLSPTRAAWAAGQRALLCGELGSGREEAPPEEAEERRKVTSMAIAASRRPLGTQEALEKLSQLPCYSLTFLKFCFHKFTRKKQYINRKWKNYIQLILE